jgi:hypothetical protein
VESFKAKHQIDLGEYPDYKEYLRFIDELFQISTEDHLYFSTILIRNWVQFSDQISASHMNMSVLIKILRDGLVPKAQKLFRISPKPVWFHATPQAQEIFTRQWLDLQEILDENQNVLISIGGHHLMD